MKKLTATVISLLPSLAFAHPGHTDNFIAAFAHPFTGVDHLLMMLCVGILAGRIGGSARWQLPLAFLSAMTCGWLIASKGYVLPGIDSGIAAGLIALGVLLAWRTALPLRAQLCVLAVFALLHGMAHGVELSRASPVFANIGFLTSTALLHGGGLGIAGILSRHNSAAYRWVGCALAVAGGGMLASI